MPYDSSETSSDMGREDSVGEMSLEDRGKRRGAGTERDPIEDAKERTELTEMMDSRFPRLTGEGETDAEPPLAELAVESRLE